MSKSAAAYDTAFGAVIGAFTVILVAGYGWKAEILVFMAWCAKAYFEFRRL